MNYDDVFLFIKLIKIGSFSGLAKVMNSTQSTISRRIQQLEDNLQLQLIRRNSHGRLEMTEDGAALYNKFSEKENLLNNAMEDVIARQKAINGSIHIAIPLLVYNKILVSFLHEFHSSYPEATIIISFIAKPVDLLKDNFDVAISMHRPTSQNAKFKLLKKSYIKLYASETYINRHGCPATLEELSQHNVVGRSIDGIPIEQLQVTNINTGEDEIVNCTSNIYLNNVNYNLAMTEHGERIINATEIFANADVKNGTLIPVLPEYSFDTVNFYLIRSNEIHSKLEKVFVEFIEESFNRFMRISDTDN